MTSTRSAWKWKPPCPTLAPKRPTRLPAWQALGPPRLLMQQPTPGRHCKTPCPPTRSEHTAYRTTVIQSDPGPAPWSSNLRRWETSAEVFLWSRRGGGPVGHRLWPIAQADETLDPLPPFLAANSPNEASSRIERLQQETGTGRALQGIESQAAWPGWAWGLGGLGAWGLGGWGPRPRSCG